MRFLASLVADVLFFAWLAVCALAVWFLIVIACHFIGLAWMWAVRRRVGHPLSPSSDRPSPELYDWDSA